MIMLFFAKTLKNKTMFNTITMVKKDTQRALVLQGGGALGAYEAGVFRVLYNWIKKDIPDDQNVFDIVAGTSIGAINAAFLVSYVIKRRRDCLLYTSDAADD